MMRADDLNLHVYPVITKMIATKQIPVLHVCSMDERKSKEFLFNKNIPQICSTNDEESKGIVDKFSTEEDK